MAGEVDTVDSESELFLTDMGEKPTRIMIFDRKRCNEVMGQNFRLKQLVSSSIGSCVSKALKEHKKLMGSAVERIQYTTRHLLLFSNSRECRVSSSKNS